MPEINQNPKQMPIGCPPPLVVDFGFRFFRLWASIVLTPADHSIKVAVGQIEAHRSFVVLPALAESVRQSGEPANLHPKRQVVALVMAGANAAGKNTVPAIANAEFST